jgi:hypothetical protein
MFTFPIFRGQDDRPTTRHPQARRRPLVEDLEGRQLLSNFIQGGHPGTGVAAQIQGNHIGTNVAQIQGGHPGTGVAEVQGWHPGANVA